MPTDYACTRIEKTVSDWTNKGAGAKQRCIFDEPKNITAGNLRNLIEAIELELFVKIDSLWFPGVDEGDTDTRVSFNRIEDAEGDEASKKELEDCKAGKIELYLADYELIIEKREVSPVTREELTAAEIKTHD